MVTNAGDAVVAMAASGVDPRGLVLQAENTAEGEAVRMEEVMVAEGTSAVAEGVAADSTVATRAAAAERAEPAATENTKNKVDGPYLTM